MSTLWLTPMRILRGSSEAEFVAAFLSGELDSPRYGETLRTLLREAGEDERVVAEPNVGDPREDSLRATLLEGYRSWLTREGLFAGFPARVDWSYAALTRAEVLSILYINWDWWLRISAGTRLPLDAAARIRRNEVPGASVESNEPIAAGLRSADPPPPLIVVAPPDRSRLVLLEGHVRITAYALFPEYLPAELEVLLGISDEIGHWSEF
jgi:hypothetical protein